MLSSLSSPLVHWHRQLTKSKPPAPTFLLRSDHEFPPDQVDTSVWAMNSSLNTSRWELRASPSGLLFFGKLNPVLTLLFTLSLSFTLKPHQSVNCVFSFRAISCISYFQSANPPTAPTARTSHMGVLGPYSLLWAIISSFRRNSSFLPPKALL